MKTGGRVGIVVTPLLLLLVAGCSDENSDDRKSSRSRPNRGRRMTTRQDKARTDLTRDRLQKIMDRLAQYKMDMGGGRNDFPTEDEGGLKALVTKPAFDDETKGANWAGPYLDANDIKDYWDQDFRYELVEQDGKMVPPVSSDGPDGEQETDDDVKSWSEDEA